MILRCHFLVNELELVGINCDEVIFGFFFLAAFFFTVLLRFVLFFFLFFFGLLFFFLFFFFLFFFVSILANDFELAQLVGSERFKAVGVYAVHQRFACMFRRLADEYELTIFVAHYSTRQQVVRIFKVERFFDCFRQLRADFLSREFCSTFCDCFVQLRLNSCRHRLSVLQVQRNLNDVSVSSELATIRNFQCVSDRRFVISAHFRNVRRFEHTDQTLCD
ncbi:hypothetical protein D5P86_00425 [Salmonella enterica subsp. enterica serovar Infantis]|nr:hypothetical protein [Salmonella enterica subsp. enterica serovar Infantis]